MACTFVRHGTECGRPMDHECHTLERSRNKGWYYHEYQGEGSMQLVLRVERGGEVLNTLSPGTDSPLARFFTCGEKNMDRIPWLHKVTVEEASGNIVTYVRISP